MEEMQSIVKRIETNQNDLEAWQRLDELVDDPQKKNDCRDQVARIKKELAVAGMPVGLPTDPADSSLKDHVTANLLRDHLLSPGRKYPDGTTRPHFLFTTGVKSRLPC